MKKLLKQIEELQGQFQEKINEFNAELFYFKIDVNQDPYGYGTDKWEVIETEYWKVVCVVECIWVEWEHGHVIKKMIKEKQEELRKIAKKFEVILNN